MSEQLPDSGGAYLDRDATGPIGIAKRTARGAKREVVSGDMGKDMVSGAVGLIAGVALAGFLGIRGMR